MKQFAAIVFDMDGVVVDSEPLHERAFLDVFAELGYADGHGIDFVAYYGRSDKAVWVDFIARHHPPQGLDELLTRKQQRFIELVRRQKPIFGAVVPLLEQLAPRYPLALASGSPPVVIDEVLALDGLRRFFPVVVSIQDVGKSKPAPDVFLRTAELLQVAPSACCVIEDAVVGVEAALAAGMSVIAITNSLPAEKLGRATWVVSTYAEIRRLLC
jgi:HAD superfamily hydrolase (TIGR01509 family)